MKGEQGLDDADKATCRTPSATSKAKGRAQTGQGQQGQQDGQGQGQGARPTASSGDAVDAQGRALEALRKGAQGLEKQMQANGQGKGGYRAMIRGQGQRKRPRPARPRQPAIAAPAKACCTKARRPRRARVRFSKSCAAVSPTRTAPRKNATIWSGC